MSATPTGSVQKSPSSKQQSPLARVGATSPVFQMIGGMGFGGDTPDGAVCGIDGVCVVPGDTADLSFTGGLSSTAGESE